MALTPEAPTATASANTNIALIKYWGKADESLTIPTTSSLSLTLAGTRTTTTVSFDGGQQGRDAVTINGAVPGQGALGRVTRFLDLVRSRSGLSRAATVSSSSTVPLAAGLASSAAGFAALAAAASRAAGLELDERALSRLARRGSGSASRSVFGGLVLWRAGSDDESSYAEPVEAAGLACGAGGESDGGTVAARSEPDLAMVVVVLSDRSKSIGSTQAMRRTMATSPLYPSWVRASAQDLGEALAAVRRGDVQGLGEVVEANALGMHATMLASRPAVIYWMPRTVEALHTVRALREEGMPAWATIDAGANVKVLTPGVGAEQVARALGERLPGARVSVHRPGAGVRLEPAAPPAGRAAR
ncbi:diphosphomevalonate decarboxylase [Actinomyces bowdenii]|uniref:diphosphomevalonate decarboxylase n=1 Tax=Actinomyces bowdenii TaxID=131109 RepID=UPI001ABBEF38|nr:diphosphomevalonate decarboxylase [Actinomyces bowdenii]MBO3723894.1 diphosphomevalonate decarboxylase [Actinomyces bowdenii]